MLCSFLSFAQLSKGQFLIGGSGTYSSTTYSYTDSKFRGVYIDGRGGIFLLNKLATGLRLGYTYRRDMGSDTDSSQYFKQKDRTISMGPFVRYYFFPSTQKVNFLVDASYFRNWISTMNNKWNAYGYAVAAGPVLFVTPNIALETTLNYEYNEQWFKTSTVSVKFGFQIHLSKNKATRAAIQQ
jgi:hypothetical protein